MRLARSCLRSHSSSRSMISEAFRFARDNHGTIPWRASPADLAAAPSPGLRGNNGYRTTRLPSGARAAPFPAATAVPMSPAL